MIKSIKTIIIEDESIFRKSLSMYLRNRPEFEVVGDFDDGEPALQFLKRKNEVAVVILDMNLPTTDGLEMTGRISKCRIIKSINYYAAFFCALLIKLMTLSHWLLR